MIGICVNKTFQKKKTKLISFCKISIWNVICVSCSIRGTLISSIYAVEVLGVLLAYIIGEYFKFYAMPLFSIILIAAFAILLLFVPESPIFLVRKNKIDVS